MNRWTTLLAALVVAAFIAIGCSGGGKTPVTPTAFLKIITPNGGEEWMRGSDQEITWVSQYIDGTVFIEYSRDNFVSDINRIAGDEPNDGSFMWEHIPSDFSDTVRVRVSWTHFPSVSDVSDSDFAIVGPWIEVLTPNGGEEWVPGTSEEITWTSQGVTGTVFIEYSKDNFVSDVNPIAVDEPNDGSFMWDPVPYDISDTVRVRVSWTDYPDVNDISDDDFSIFTSGWARTWGGPGWDWALGVATDGSGNVYATGSFEGTVDFDPGGGDPHTSNGGHDAFVSKFDLSGNFEWARTWGGPDWVCGRAVATDNNGNVYVVGDFESAADFDPEGGDQHTSNGGTDVFLSKFDSWGNFCWARVWGSQDEVHGDYGIGIAVDGAGDVYVTGTIYTEAGPAFLNKFDPSGNLVWARTWGAYEGWGVATDGFGNAYVTGTFMGTVDFDPDGGEPHTSIGLDAYLSKFDSSGNLEWAQTWGGQEEWLGEHCFGVATDSYGNVYVTGKFECTVDFNPAGGDPHTSNGYGDAYLSKFDSSGTFEWARTWGGSDWEWGQGVATDGSGSVYVTGAFVGTADFNPGGGDPHTSNGYTDLYLSKFDASGGFEWVRTWGGPDTVHNMEDAWEVAVDGFANSYVVGDFRGTADFAPTDPPCNEDPDEHTSNAYGDAFLTKHLPDGCW